MPTVHIFAALGRFASREALQAFVTPTYSEDGDQIDSSFMREVGFTQYEPMCIEVIHSEEAKLLSALLEGVSYSEQWLPKMGIPQDADSAVCVFSPNVIVRPESSSMRYCGAFSCDS